jgi:alanine racemase
VNVRAQASVNVAAIERNCARLCSELSPTVALCAVVKADGYGHGAAQSARAALAGGASRLAVAAAREARELREAGLSAAGTGGEDLREAPILVMGALTPPELREALAARADVVVWHERDVETVAAAGVDGCTSSSTPAWAGSARATLPRPRAWWPPRATPRVSSSRA